MKKRAIVIFPQFENLHLIEQFRQQFDPQAFYIAAHITVVFPFESELAIEPLQAHLQQAVLPIKPFSIQLQGITGHEGEYLFLNVKRGNDHLIDLHDRLYSGLLSAYQSSAHTYLPHVTLGRLAGEVAFATALATVQETRAVFTTEVAEISVVRLESGRPLHIETGVKL